MSILERSVDQLIERLPEGRRGTVRLACLVVGFAIPLGYGALEHSWRTQAEADVATLRHEKELLTSRLAPFEATAARLYPGEKIEKGLSTLAIEVKAFADQTQRSSMEALVAGMEGCYVEATRNQWAFDALHTVEVSKMKLRQPNSTACAELASHPKLPTSTRNKLSLYIADMNEASTAIGAKFATCNSRGFRPEEIEYMNHLGETGTEETTRVKQTLEAHLAQLKRPLPVYEITNAAGERAICSNTN